MNSLLSKLKTYVVAKPIQAVLVFAAIGGVATWYYFCKRKGRKKY